MASYAIFDEQYYLSQYPWLKPAIDAGVIQSGREHFEKFGQAAGLTKISRYFDEDTYLERNPDLKPFVRTVSPNAPFATGLDHFIQYGYEEGRSRLFRMERLKTATSISLNSASKRSSLGLHFWKYNTYKATPMFGCLSNLEP